MNISEDIDINCSEIPEQMKLLVDIINANNMKNILEIGFNAGHSADLFLGVSPDIKVTSIDTGDNACVLSGKKYIDNKYPNRHNLIIGDSKTVIPLHMPQGGNDSKYDMIYIDGGMDYETVISDLIHCKRVSSSTTLIILNRCIHGEVTDVQSKTVQNVWKTVTDNLFIHELGYCDFGLQGRGMAWGIYHMK